MLRVDNELVARCFVLLRDPQFAPLVEYMRDSRNDTLNSLAETGDARRIHMLQGAAGVFKEILEHIDQAEILIKKLRANGRPL